MSREQQRILALLTEHIGTEKDSYGLIFRRA